MSYAGRRTRVVDIRLEGVPVGEPELNREAYSSLFYDRAH